MLIVEQMDEIFEALERQIREEEGERVSLVIIGGTALAALGVLSGGLPKMWMFWER